MAFAALNNAQTTWFKTNRHGGLPSGNAGTALVSDLLVNDYLVGMRATVTATGTTTSGVRTLTVNRFGQGTMTIQWVAASTVIIIRP